MTTEDAARDEPSVESATVRAEEEFETPELPSRANKRMRALFEELKEEVRRCRQSAKSNRVTHTVLFWLSVAFGLAASFWGVVGPAMGRDVSPAEVSGLAAIATGLQIALRQARLHDRADWSQRKADKLTHYIRRMRYSFRHQAAQEEIDEIVRGCNELDDKMALELLQFGSESAGVSSPRSRKLRT